MKEAGILFSAGMVLAILDGRKTQTRRMIKPQPYTNGIRLGPDGEIECHDGCYPPSAFLWKGGWLFQDQFSPYGDPGDRLWVRETWARDSDIEPAIPDRIVYKADKAARYFSFKDKQPTSEIFWISSDYRPEKWRPSIFMPRWASRITLEITDIRVERLQEISEGDAIAEGVQLAVASGVTGNRYYDCGVLGRDGMPECLLHRKASDAYGHIWRSINGEGSWNLNPWVWVISFKRVQP